MSFFESVYLTYCYVCEGEEFRKGLTLKVFDFLDELELKTLPYSCYMQKIVDCFIACVLATELKRNVYA